MTESGALPAVLIVIFIALGVLACLIMFIFGKRQIQRLTLRSQKGPHRPVGQGAGEGLRQEVERRLARCADIYTVPSLVHPSLTCTHPNYDRIMAMQVAKLLECEVRCCGGVYRCRGQSLRQYLHMQRGDSGGAVGDGCLSLVPVALIGQFCSLYEHARQSAAPFHEHHLNAMLSLHRHIVDSLHSKTGVCGQIVTSCTSSTTITTAVTTGTTAAGGNTTTVSGAGVRPRSLHVANSSCNTAETCV